MQLEVILLNNKWTITIIIIIACVIIYAIRKGKEGLYNAALYLVSVAEYEWGSKTGKIKFAQVLTTIKKMYPVISFFLDEKTLETIIENALAEMKEIIASKEIEEEAIEE